MKHGRVTMAAAMGYITLLLQVPRLPVPSKGLKFEDVPSGLAAISKVPVMGWVQILFFAGVIEGAFGFGGYKNGTREIMAGRSSHPRTRQRKQIS